MLENWVWDKSILQRLSKHYKTGDSLPNELIDKKLAIKNLHEATFTLRQIFFGTFDLLVHTANVENLLSLEDSSSISMYGK